MSWTKLGLIFKPDPTIWWTQTHAMMPTLEKIDENKIKIYFSGRNKDNQSHIGFFIINLKRPTEILEKANEPILLPGRLGCFDDNGVTPSCVIKDSDKTLLYYVGWNPGSTTRMNIFGGLAISKDNGKTFERYSEAPIIERCRVNPFINTAPFVFQLNNKWIMYYVAGTGWHHKDLPQYNIQIALSKNGLQWERKGHVAIDFIEDEFALARPFIFEDNGIFKMYFSSKSCTNPNYCLKCAESQDGLNWHRSTQHEVIEKSKNDLDNEMIEYGAVTIYKGKKYLFYNGNNYGYYGVHLAIES